MGLNEKQLAGLKRLLTTFPTSVVKGGGLHLATARSLEKAGLVAVDYYIETEWNGGVGNHKRENTWNATLTELGIQEALKLGYRVHSEGECVLPTACELHTPILGNRIAEPKLGHADREAGAAEMSGDASAASGGQSDRPKVWPKGKPYFMDIGAGALIAVPEDLGHPIFRKRDGELIGFLTLEEFRSPAVVREIMKGRFPEEQARWDQLPKVRLPAKMVRGLVEGDAMVGPDPRDIRAVEILQAAEYVPANRGESAILRGSTEDVLHIVNYLEVIRDDWHNVIHAWERFGFSRAEAGKQAEKIRRQIDG
ncbi:hypothetical protein [Streptomyces flavofungini]|uniref:hypothetical protein n=1 Tax=Streptomyces flavofungini TaxID=68200 RepID=UPI0025B17143|nr:hypothetical protein [Streptomyces flavofungini]WJV49900.1 hypothetical protein QUY26_32885 [Streptomyces flavofungini]